MAREEEAWQDAGGSAARIERGKTGASLLHSQCTLHRPDGGVLTPFHVLLYECGHRARCS